MRGAAACWRVSDSKHNRTVLFISPTSCPWLQATIYEDVGAPVVSNALKGFNCSIFAYGQTGSVRLLLMTPTGASVAAKTGQGQTSSCALGVSV